MRETLRQAEKDLVIATTQKERTAALFLASTLREELGRLSRHNRWESECLELVQICIQDNVGKSIVVVKTGTT
jgi:hypothetical protein